MKPNLTTNDAFHIYGHGTYDGISGLENDPVQIYNHSWPLGNQVTIGYHNDLIESVKRELASEKQFRIDFHTGDTAQFIVFCSEMHINCDNQCSNYEFYNKLSYEEFKKYPPNNSFIHKLLYGKQLEFNGRNLPQKYKWMWWNGKELEIRESYLGLTNEQVNEIENYLKS
jgi:hypothetical protein